MKSRFNAVAKKVANELDSYRFNDGEKVDLSNPSKIVMTTRNLYYKLPYEKGKTKYRYVVTAVDRFHNESPKGKSKKIKL